jgi:hypothetical protein
MSLKFPFKFHHVLSSTIYTAKLRENQYDTVDVYWTDDDGREDSVDYYLSGVVDNVNAGLWKIIEETTIDPLVEIRQSEYTALIEEVNLLQELLAEANARNQSIPEPTVFKPTTEYTIRDWEQALAEKWVFRQYDGTIINIIRLDYSEDTSYPVETESSWLRLDGTEYDFGSSDSDIVERIK